MSITPIILCGGSGTRLWPLSRQAYPKQFLILHGKHSLFQQCIQRAIKLSFDIKEILIVTNEAHRFVVLDQLQIFDINIKFRIILEPVSKNTAASLSLASFYLYQKKKKTMMIVLPADQFIEKNIYLKKVINQAIKNTTTNLISLLGVKPTYPDTGYGYIEFDKTQFENKIKQVRSFHEKPNQSKAKKFLSSGNYYWNVGIFILNPDTWITALGKLEPKIYENVKKSWQSRTIDNLFIRPDKIWFDKSPNKSIDYAVIEKFYQTDLKLNLIELKTKWSDLGTFKSIYDISKKDKFGNYLKGNIEAFQSKNNISISEKKNISLIGVNDLIVIETADMVLVANKFDSDGIKKIVKQFELKKSELLKNHSKVHRPWGYFEVIDQGVNFKVKRITVKANSSLSYQSHKNRNEHWVVVKGKAVIIKDDIRMTLQKDQSTYIKKNEKHQLTNENNSTLEIIEIQTGKVISEEDITRYRDNYGRK